MRFLVALTFVLLSLSLGCSKIVTTTVSAPQATEESYCTTSCVTNNTCTGSTVAVSGTALYERREFEAVGPGSGLGGRDTSGTGAAGNFPIRGAEVQVLKNGSIFHCTTTTSTGTYSFNLPDDSATYTIKVNSRSYTADNKVSVLDTPSTKNYYSVTTTVVATGPGPLVANVANATYNGDLKGGAFNILDKIYQANDFLKNQATGTSFSVDHKATVYWKRGVNPSTYVGGDANEGLSYYLTGTDSIYILGGIDGDVNSEDTDHFDDSIIVHEYGHFIEDNYSISDSPGGFHNGRRIVDPRLAWSEAFATFLMAVVLEDPIYRDTYGNVDGTTGYAIHYNTETNSLAGGANKLDTPVANNIGEGNFREFAIVRLLVDLFDNIAGGLSDSDADGLTLPFEDFWDVFVGTFKTTEDFVDSGHFFSKLDAAVATDFSAFLTDDEIEVRADRREYGFSNLSILGGDPDLIAGGGDASCEWDIEAEDQIGDNSEGRDTIVDDGDPITSAFSLSNQFKSNDFFLYYHSGGALTVYLEYTPIGGNADLDLYIYKADYTYGSSSGIQAYSNDSSIDAPVDAGTEYISTNASAGYYLINVMYWTNHYGSRASGAASTAFATSAKYFLRIGSNSYFCQ